MSDFVVMRKGATMAVASSRVTSLAIGQEVDPEALGGWELHTGTTGLVDVAVDSDEEALDVLRRALSYLPSHAGEAPPVVPVPAGSDEAARTVLDVFPESRSSVYDVRRVVERVADRDSLFEFKPRFGKSLVTALVRIDGHSVGVIANNPKFKGGAIDVDAMHKATSFLVMCDSFNIPLVFMVDQPGFLIGIEGEKRGAPGRIMNWMNALSQVTVPKLSVIMRKSYGQAYLNMGGGRYSDAIACWPMADLGFMDPSVAVNVLHGKGGANGEAPDAKEMEALKREVSRDTSAWALAALYEAQAVLDPRDTRQWLKDMLALHRRVKTVSEHHLANWPTSY
jgi:acetyl-CoA carboxylase carboxyltransferase component